MHNKSFRMYRRRALTRSRARGYILSTYVLRVPALVHELLVSGRSIKLKLTRPPRAGEFPLSEYLRASCSRSFVSRCLAAIRVSSWFLFLLFPFFFHLEFQPCIFLMHPLFLTDSDRALSFHGLSAQPARNTNSSCFSTRWSFFDRVQRALPAFFPFYLPTLRGEKGGAVVARSSIIFVGFAS